MYFMDSTDNGLPIIYKHIPHMSTFLFSVWFDVGSKDETAESNGITHFIEHLMFNIYNKPKYQEIVNKLGLLMNASTTREYTYFYIQVESSNYKDAVTFFSELLKERCNANDVEREKSTILSEYQAYLGSQKTLFDTFAQALWGNERYGLSVIGREEVISGMTLEAIEEYRESKYLNDKIRLIALGSIEYKSAFRTIENCFKNFVISHKISILSNSITLAAQSSGVVLSQKKYNMLNISLGFKTFAFPTRERLVIDFISHMLVSGNKGILFEDIRETKKLCYAIGTNHLCFTHGGGFCIWAAIDKSKLETFIHEILLVVATIKMKEFIESKIDIVKNQMSLMYRTMLEDPSNILPYIGKYFLNGQIFSENVIMNDIKRISVDDIALILNDYFVIDNLALGIVGDLNYEELQSAVDRVL